KVTSVPVDAFGKLGQLRNPGNALAVANRANGFQHGHRPFNGKESSTIRSLLPAHDEPPMPPDWGLHQLWWRGPRSSRVTLQRPTLEAVAITVILERLLGPVLIYPGAVETIRSFFSESVDPPLVVG